MKQNILESRRSVAFKLSALTMAAIGLPSATNVLAQASSAASNTAQSAKFILPVSAGSGSLPRPA